MSNSCEVYGESPEFYHDDMRRARKPHKCVECGHTILPGEIYEHVRGKWEGEVFVYATCEPCTDLRDSLAGEGGCWVFGQMFEDYYEYLGGSLPEEVAQEISERIRIKHKGGPNRAAPLDVVGFSPVASGRKKR